MAYAEKQSKLVAETPEGGEADPFMVSVPPAFSKKILRPGHGHCPDRIFPQKKDILLALKVGKPAGELTLRNGRSRGLSAGAGNIRPQAGLSKILEKTGGRVHFFVSGGAPWPKDIAEFFYASGDCRPPRAMG